jgi:hypothetical protein
MDSPCSAVLEAILGGKLGGSTTLARRAALLEGYDPVGT